MKKILNVFLSLKGTHFGGFALLTLLLFMQTGCMSYSDAVPINMKWDVSTKDSLLVQEFSISEHRVYQLFIEFGTIHQPLSDEEWTKLHEFTGDGSQAPYDLETKKNLSLFPETEHQKALERIREGKAEWRYGKPGTIIPVHLKIEKLEKTGTILVLADQTIETGGIAGGGFHGLSRTVKDIALRPGRYRLSVNTLKDTQLPPNIETWLIVKARVNSSIIKD